TTLHFDPPQCSINGFRDDSPTAHASPGERAATALSAPRPTNGVRTTLHAGTQADTRFPAPERPAPPPPQAVAARTIRADALATAPRRDIITLLAPSAALPRSRSERPRVWQLTAETTTREAMTSTSCHRTGSGSGG